MHVVLNHSSVPKGTFAGVNPVLVQFGTAALALVVSLLIAPLLFLVFTLPIEYGWRSYLFPRLLPLGKFRAVVVGGVLWALWLYLPMLTRLVAANRLDGVHLAALSVLPGYDFAVKPLSLFLALVMMVMFGIALTAFLGRVWLEKGTAMSAALWLACIFAQAAGFWSVLFPDESLLVRGWAGLAGSVIWLVATVVAGFVYSRTNRSAPPVEEPHTER